MKLVNKCNSLQQRTVFRAVQPESYRYFLFIKDFRLFLVNHPSNLVKSSYVLETISFKLMGNIFIMYNFMKSFSVGWNFIIHLTVYFNQKDKIYALFNHQDMMKQLYMVQMGRRLWIKISSHILQHIFLLNEAKYMFHLKQYGETILHLEYDRRKKAV